jgi:hypothetical protein
MGDYMNNKWSGLEFGKAEKLVSIYNEALQFLY